MSFETWLAFAAASFVVLMIPGPTIMLIVGYALGEGRKAAFGAIRGVLLGDMVAIMVTAIGLGAVLAASATVFTLLKWVGAAYLVYLGIRLWRTPVAEEGLVIEPMQARKADRARAIRAFVVTVLNPKTLAFFVAFLPQFMSADDPVAPQVAILTVTFVVLAAVANGSYAVLAGTIRERLTRPETVRWINRIGGSFMIGAGVLTATMRRAD